MEENVLEVESVTKQFPAVQALKGVSLRFALGEVHGIVGENGAGKSTLMKILSGVESPTEGTLRFSGQPAQWSGVNAALDSGIVMIHQELNLVDDLTVAENIFLGREPTKGLSIDYAEVERRSQELLTRVSARFSPRKRVGDLPLAEQQLVEIAKALSYDAKVMIMDEPTAVLTEKETEALFRLIKDLREQGVAVIYISHILSEVLALSDRITVMRDGQVVGEVKPSETTAEEIAKMMVGRDLGDLYPVAPPLTSTEPILEVENLVVPGHVRGISFSLRPGEVLGFAGLVGSGRTETAEGIMALRRSTGNIKFEGAPAKIKQPRDAIEMGIAYLSEDRKGLGLLVELDCVQNVTLANLKAYANPILNKQKELTRTQQWKEKLDVRVGDLGVLMRTLSGGNQQKFALAKWLETEAKVLILDEPTRGIDVGSKREIYHLIHDLAQQGMACIVISSEMTELIGICHRILVLQEGEIKGELTGSEMTEENIIVLASGIEEATA